MSPDADASLPERAAAALALAEIPTSKLGQIEDAIAAGRAIFADVLTEN
jgi:hypothetical protein